MTELENRIREVLTEYPSGLKARQISRIIRENKSSINRFLYSHQDLFVRGDDYVWKLINTDIFASDPVLCKLQNQMEAAIFTWDDFNKLADWKAGVSYSPGGKTNLYKTASGNRISYDSKSELLLLEYLNSNDRISDIGGQALCIKYSSAYRDNLDYYPDIVAYTTEGHIAIFEVKAASAMDQHKNMEKYESLENYCKKQGFLYMMVDPQQDYMTFEELCDMEVSSDLLEMFEVWNNEPLEAGKIYKHFDEETVNEWYDLYGNGYTKTEFKLQVHSLIAYYGWYNKFQNGFMVYDRPVK